MGAALTNLDSLVQMPTGCGEQNMINFAPNIAVLEYVKASGSTGLADETAKAKEFVKMGYQRQLSYRRGDGSFSAFGENDKAGSTWLTAFVLRSFKVVFASNLHRISIKVVQAAEPFATIDSNVLERGLEFLESRQRMPVGSFEELGEVHHEELQVVATFHN